MKIGIVLAALVVSVGASNIHDLKQKILATHGRGRSTNLVPEGPFDYGVTDSKDVNQLAVKISQVGQPVMLSREEQVSKWYPLPEGSPLRAKGYDSVASADNGWVFRPSEDKMDSLSLFQCESNLGVRVKEEKATLIQYNCGEVDTSFLDEEETISAPNATSFLSANKTHAPNSTAAFIGRNATAALIGRNATAAFIGRNATAAFIGRNATAAFVDRAPNATAAFFHGKRVKRDSASAKNSTFLELEQNSTNGNATFLEMSEEAEEDNENMVDVQRIMRMLTPQLRAFVSGGLPQFWRPSPDGHVPQGFRSNWEAFDYPYYAVTDTGCYGCAMTDFVTPELVDKTVNPLTGQESWCKQPVYYPFDKFTKNDILPTSMYYTSGCGARWAGSIMPGSTISTQPNSFGSSTSDRTGQTSTNVVNSSPAGTK